MNKARNLWVDQSKSINVIGTATQSVSSDNGSPVMLSCI